MILRAVCIAGLLASNPVGAQEAVPRALSVGSTSSEQPPRWIRGTDVELMVVREVNSRSAKPGDCFKLRVNAPVLLDGATVIPVGATAWGEVISAAGTSAAGGKGQLSLRLLHVDTRWGPVNLSGTKGTEGASNTGGVILGVLGFGLLGLLNRGGNATFKAGDIIHGYIAEGETRMGAPFRVSADVAHRPADGSEGQVGKGATLHGPIE